MKLFLILLLSILLPLNGFGEEPPKKDKKENKEVKEAKQEKPSKDKKKVEPSTIVLEILTSNK